MTTLVPVASDWAVTDAIVKSPNSSRGWTYDWSNPPLGAQLLFLPPDFLLASSWFVEDPPDGALVVDAGRCSFTRTTTTCWLSGGTVGVVYRLRDQVMTQCGRASVRTLPVVIQAL
jgi:hypothetical protein